MKLYFLRHGPAEEKKKWKGEDATRPLTRAGIEGMERIAQALAALDLKIDVIVTSPLVRAKQTAEIVARRLTSKPKLVEDKRLTPGFNIKRLRALLRDHQVNALMLVGHEPDLSATISHLIGGGLMVCKKGGLALVEFPKSSGRRGELVWLIPPQVLAR